MILWFHDSCDPVKYQTQQSSPTALWILHHASLSVECSFLIRFIVLSVCMNEWCIYIALLLCNAEHPKWFSIMMGLSSTSCKQTVGVNCQKALFLFHLSTEHFPRKIVVCSGTLWQRSVVPFVCLFFNNGVFLGLCPWSPDGLVCGV